MSEVEREMGYTPKLIFSDDDIRTLAENALIVVSDDPVRVIRCGAIGELVEAAEAVTSRAVALYDENNLAAECNVPRSDIDRLRTALQGVRKNRR